MRRYLDIIGFWLYLALGVALIACGTGIALGALLAVARLIMRGGL